MGSQNSCEYARVTEIIREVLGLEAGLVNWIRNSERAGIDTNKILQTSAKRGTKIHAYISKVLSGKKARIQKQYKTRIENLLEFLKEKKDIQTEVALKTDDPIKHQGHLDYLYYDNGNPVVADLKTGGKRIDAELQVNGYGYLLKKNLNIEPVRLELIYLRPTYLDVVVLKYDESLWKSILKIYEWKKSLNWIK